MTMAKSTLLASAAAIGMISGGTIASAQDLFSGLYLSGGAGVNFLNDITLTPGTTSINPRVLDFETGFVGSVALGTMIGQHFRAEGELSFRHNDVESVTVQNEGPQGFNGGEATAFAVMLNGWFDLPTGTNFTPYVGGGIGGAEISINADTNAAGPCLSAPSSCVAVDFDGSDFVFAFQLGTGVAFGAAGGPQLTLDYRYFHADGIDVPYTGWGSGSPASASDYEAHSIMLGGRIPIGGP